MEITMMNESCVRVRLSSGECRTLGISYDSFSPSSTEARIFIASVLSRLELMGSEVRRQEKLTAEIFEQEDGGMLIYVSGKGLKCRRSEQLPMHAVWCATPDEVIERLKALGGNAELYSYRGGYALVTDKPGGGLSAVDTAKIKEYGTLLSDTPYDMVCDLFKSE